MICRDFKNTYITKLFTFGFYWLPGFSNKINATRYCDGESCPIVNENIVKSKVKFKINLASMNDPNIPITTFASSLALQARKHLSFFVSTAREKSELDIILIIS